MVMHSQAGGGLSCGVPGAESSGPVVSCPKQDPRRAISSDGLTWLGFPSRVVRRRLPKSRGIKASGESPHSAALQCLLRPGSAPRPTSPNATFQATFK